MPAIPKDSISLQHGVSQAFKTFLRRNAHATRSETTTEAAETFVTRVSGSIARRAVVPGIIPTYYQDQDRIAAATVVGITLGSVVAFLFICWLIVALCGLNPQGGQIAAEEEVVVRKRAKTSSSSKRSRRSRHTEVREHSRSPRRASVILEERRTSAPRRSSVIVEERIRVPGDDIVEVIEEHSDFEPPRRKRSHRNDGYRY